MRKPSSILLSLANLWASDAPEIGDPQDRADSLIRELKIAVREAKLRDPNWDRSCIEEFHRIGRFLTNKQEGLEIYRTLIDAGMPIDVYNQIGQTAFHQANPCALRCFAALGANLDMGDKKGQSALNWLCNPDSWLEWPDSQKILTLVELGADVNSSNRHQYTPLISVCASTKMDKEDQVTLVKLLLEHGANAHAVDHIGKSAMAHLLGSMGDLRAFHLLVEHGAPTSSEQFEKAAANAVVKCDAKSLEKILDTGPVKASEDSKLLLWACKYGHEDCAMVLLERGWDPCTPGEIYLESKWRKDLQNPVSITALEIADMMDEDNKASCKSVILSSLAKRQALKAMQEIQVSFGVKAPSSKPI